MPENTFDFLVLFYIGNLYLSVDLCTPFRLFRNNTIKSDSDPEKASHFLMLNFPCLSVSTVFEKVEWAAFKGFLSLSIDGMRYTSINTELKD